MKRILIHLFCLSITLQSVLGQFLFRDYSGGSYGLLPVVVSFFSDKTETGHTHFTVAVGSDRDMENINENQIPKNNSTGGLRFVRDSVMDHLFSPSNFPNETTHVSITFSYLYVRNCIDLFVIEEKISNFVHFYASFVRNIQIGLSTTKLIYPFHNFY